MCIFLLSELLINKGILNIIILLHQHFDVVAGLSTFNNIQFI